MVTDSLAMAGVTRGRDAGRTAVQALRAGTDVLLMPPSPAAARAALVACGARRRRWRGVAPRAVRGPPGRAADSTSPGPRRGSGRPARRGPPRGRCPPRRHGHRRRLPRPPGRAMPSTPTATRARSRTSPRAARAAGLTVLLRRSPPRRWPRRGRGPSARRRSSRKAYRQRTRAWQEARGASGASPRGRGPPRGRPPGGRHRRSASPASRTRRSTARSRSRPTPRACSAASSAPTRDRDVRRHPRRDVGPGRGAARTGAGAGTLPVTVAGVARRGC